MHRAAGCSSCLFFHCSLGSHLRTLWGWECWPGKDGLARVAGTTPRVSHEEMPWSTSGMQRPAWEGWLHL